jgi:hypothetical protein
MLDSVPDDVDEEVAALQAAVTHPVQEPVHVSLQPDYLIAESMFTLRSGPNYCETIRNTAVRLELAHQLCGQALTCHYY